MFEKGRFSTFARPSLGSSTSDRGTRVTFWKTLLSPCCSTCSLALLVGIGRASSERTGNGVCFVFDHPV